jgi:hypothetical protein
MLASRVSLTEINHINQRFWRDQRVSMDERLANDAICETAIEAMQGIALPDLNSIYEALEYAERVGRRFLAWQARKGGYAPKADALQGVIDKIVTRRPSITLRELTRQMKLHQGIPPIQDIDDGSIWFTNRDGSTKKAPLTGLKDRLSRAKAKLRSR